MSSATHQQDRQLLTSSIRSFYEDYHKYRKRIPNKWMRRVYWPAFRGTVLEVGGGTLLPARPNYTVTDLSVEAVSRALNARIPALVSDGTNLPFPTGAFDTVACYDVLEHVVEASNFIAEMCRVAGRRIIIAGPNYIGPHSGGISRYLPLRLWSYLGGEGRVCYRITDPYLIFDEQWEPDRDAVSAPNAGWVAEQMRAVGVRNVVIRSWEYDHGWLNFLPAIRSLGPFMFVVGEK
jgi:hypothetical protein